MGQGSKKKKPGGSGRKKNKGRGPVKDHASDDDGVNKLLEEITALSAIFEEDIEVSGSPPQITLKIRPYSKGMGYEDLDVSALLLVRCISGYPYKCPKLQITPEKGLTKTDADNLLSLLQEQANTNSREGRVMIYNLVDAAQEFLSAIVPPSQSHEPKVLRSSTDNSSQCFQDDFPVSSNPSISSGEPFVYGFVDLFGGSKESWHRGIEMDEKRGITLPAQSHSLDGSNLGYEALEKKLNKNLKPLSVQVTKQGPSFSPVGNLGTLKEETDHTKSISSTYSGRSLIEEHESEDINLAKNILLHEDDDSDFNREPSESVSSQSLVNNQPSQTTEKDLLMVHLLRLACSSKGQLFDDLPQITTELCNLGVLSECVRDLASKSASVFNKTFEDAFQRQMGSSKVSQFWKPISDFGGPSMNLPSSRYLNDFEELRFIGYGGFGHVVLCQNKLDGRQYAVKKIRLKDESLPVDDRILREVATLSRLQHQHVVRYYQAWFETGVFDTYGDQSGSSGTAASSTFSDMGARSADIHGHDKIESTYLYIQMEYCPRTLRQVFESYSHFDKEVAWHLSRQIVQGLAHIHGQGIIHRDLTPNNIFFDSRNDIKIGDFGLAKFLKLELDQDPGFPADTNGVSVDGTGQVGTYFYTAPEIEQGWPKIDEKADMYSLGVVFFELWHPFGTAMERNVVLSDLKLKGEFPATWVSEFPEQASLFKRLVSPSPSDRPSATELLQHEFPPKMESELLDNMLRTMQTSDDSSVYDKVVHAIFDEEMLKMKSLHQHNGRISGGPHDSSSIMYSDFDTELRDYIVEITREVFKQHCAKRLEIIPMRLLEDCPQFSRNTVKLLTHGGDVLELCHEMRLPFASWIVTNQKFSFKRYELSSVYRRAIGHSSPNHYLQGDFDIIGGAKALTEAEVLKVTLDVISRFFHPGSYDIHLNHGDLLNAIWSWAGIEAQHREKVAELLSMMGTLRPESSERKSKWAVIRRQLLQELNLDEAVVNRLQAVGLRFCGAADHALPRLRGALPTDKCTHKALDELSDFFNYLRIWRIEEHVYINALMPPTESYHRDLFFQIFFTKDNSPGSLIDGTLLAVGGRYDYLLHQMWDNKYKTNAPGAVGGSLALETIIQHSPVDFKPIRNAFITNILVCNKGGGGLLVERMELVAELWEANIKAEFVLAPDPSLKEQYEYASEHGIKCIVIITDAGVSKTGLVKVRHLELRKEKGVERDKVVRFLLDALAAQFKNPSVWL